MTDRVRNQTSLHRFPVGETGLAFATNSLSAQPATRFVALFRVFALDFAAPHAIIPAVGSANVSLLAVLLWSAASASFSRTSWRAAILGPFLCSPESQTPGCEFFQLQEMHDGKEVVLWQSEL
jgi:hypothetical protein